MEQDFAGKVAFVTGGASGLGAASVRLFARRGAKVAIVDRSIDAARALAEALRAEGGKAHAIAADVAHEPDVAAAIAETVATFGGLDCAFNNAGIVGQPASFESYDPGDWQKVIAINLTGVFLCMQHELRVMLRAGRGAIVNTSSGAGFVPAPLQPAYTAAKHGVLGLTKVAAREHAAHGIRVNAVCPGIFDTPMARLSAVPDSAAERAMLAMMPGGRFGRPEELAEVAVWLCSEAASFVSGESLVVDGGGLCR